MSARDKCPAHYCFSDLQPWDVIDSWGLDYYLGNVLKYICRAGRKSPDVLVDLNKALHYLQKEVELAERELAESCEFLGTQEFDEETGTLIKCPLCGSSRLKYDGGFKSFSCKCGAIFRLDSWEEEDTTEDAMKDEKPSWQFECWPTLVCSQCRKEMECISEDDAEETLEYCCDKCGTHMFVRLAND